MTISTIAFDVLSFQTATTIGQNAGSHAGIEDCYVRPLGSGYAVFTHTGTGRMSLHVRRRTAERLLRAGMEDVVVGTDDEKCDHVAFHLPMEA